jgi:hypothetical protein
MACNNAKYCECDKNNKRICKEGWEGHCACSCTKEYTAGKNCQEDTNTAACTLCGASETASGLPCPCKAKYNMPYETEQNCLLGSGLLSVPLGIGKILYHVVTGAKVMLEAIIPLSVPAFIREYINDAFALVTGFLGLETPDGNPIKLQISQWEGKDETDPAEVERRIQPDSDEMKAADLLGHEVAEAVTPNSDDLLDGVRLFSTMLAR